ncbi:ATP-dependent DNA helicase [Microbulbifer sp. VTAC004]|uniref:ATP-dependent DNA helicase n=1 Tax=Microbulbifer sp. VTAC004 TaxID=3243386 RepID=UPI0040399EE9
MAIVLNEAATELHSTTTISATKQASFLRLSVGELVAFSCRSGDLINDAGSGPSAQEGIRTHQKLQKKRPKGSEAEYPLQVQVRCEGYDVVLTGRVDIFHPQADLHTPVQIDEIKTTYCPPSKLPEAIRQLQWAQLKVYGFCYLFQQRHGQGGTGEGSDRVALQMLWYNLKEKKPYPELQEFNWEALESFTLAALADYIQWHKSWQEHRQQVATSAQALAFPFPKYRPGQRQLAVATYRCLRDGGELVAEAPTGIGKTISTLFPAIKALGEKQLDQLVYLTAKNSGRQVVRETVESLHKRGLELSLLEIQARDKTCACSLGMCSRDQEGVCPRTIGFFDRLPAARKKLLGSPLLSPQVLAKVAEEMQLCPFELSLQMLPWADLIVCDFNYVFDPLVRLTALQEQSQRRALLVDEAHNLSDRACDMYSVTLSRKETRRAAASCKGSHPKLQRSIQALVRAIDRWVKQLRDPEATSKSHAQLNKSGSEVWVTSLTSPENQPVTVSRAAHKVLLTVSELWESSQSPPEEISEWLKSIYRYVCIEQDLSEQHQALTRVFDAGTPWQEQQFKLLCLNAAGYIQQTIRQFHGAILFSATLRPANYIFQQLGVNSSAPYMKLPSPFLPSQQGVFLCPYVDTRYKSRNQATENLVEIIARTYQGHPGNYLVFFPSYRFLQQVAVAFEQSFPEVDLLQQEPGASESQRAAFLAAFTEGSRTLGFAIMGGVFGEGVDYVGNKLIGTIIVGTGLPQVNEEQELIRKGFDNGTPTTVGAGFDIAYRYPGLTRVLQTAGRVIRSESDRGVIVLADYRFTDRFYQSLYPEHWNLEICSNGTALSKSLEAFWHSWLK